MTEKKLKELLKDYEWEVEIAKRFEREGRLEISSVQAGKELARGRETVPIAEYRTYWEAGLKALKAGASPEEYDY